MKSCVLTTPDRASYLCLGKEKLLSGTVNDRCYLNVQEKNGVGQATNACSRHLCGSHEEMGVGRAYNAKAR